jgi:hypothetical protein
MNWKQKLQQLFLDYQISDARMFTHFVEWLELFDNEENYLFDENSKIFFPGKEFTDWVETEEQMDKLGSSS